MAKKGKVGREKRRRANKGSAISLFVRGKITAHKYWELTGQNSRINQRETA
jgi:hypothetical protein